MIETSLKDRLADRKKGRSKSMDYFYAPFNITPAFIATQMDLKESEISVEGFEMYNHMTYIVSSLMCSKELTEFVLKMCIIREEAAKKFGFDEEFDWITHAVVAAQLYVGKGDLALKRYSWIHANSTLIHHYAIKCWTMLLDAQNGTSGEIYKYLPQLQDKYENKEMS